MNITTLKKGKEISLAPSPDTTVILDYSPITNYIKERITHFEKTNIYNISYKEGYVDGLQAVLSKIEHLQELNK